MFQALHWLLIAAYLLAPPAALVLAVRARRRGDRARLPGLILTAGTGVILGAGLTQVYATVGAAPLPVGQALLAGYFAFALLVLLKGLDAGAVWAARKVFVRGPAGKGKSRLRAALVQGVRLAVLLGIGLPWVLAAAMVYRPKVLPADDPQTQLGLAFQPVRFHSADGVELAGWWIPAQSGPTDRTVIVCHGLGAGKSNQLVLAGVMATGGFNALIFDFRAHGGSGGQLSSFGDLEQQDVLAAVKWVGANRPGQSKHLYGLGISMGGAALIGAAAEPAGRGIEAVAVFSTFDRLPLMAEEVTAGLLRPALLSRLVARETVFIASMHVGSNLFDLAPADAAPHLWPRPLFVLHGTGDKVIPFRRGQALWRAAAFNRQHLWVRGADHDGLVNDPDAVRAVRQFFLTAKERPVI